MLLLISLGKKFAVSAFAWCTVVIHRRINSGTYTGNCFSFQNGIFFEFVGFYFVQINNFFFLLGNSILVKKNLESREQWKYGLILHYSFVFALLFSTVLYSFDSVEVFDFKQMHYLIYIRLQWWSHISNCFIFQKWYFLWCCGVLLCPDKWFVYGG